MTPHLDQLVNTKLDRTTVRLADDSIIKATAQGHLKHSITFPSKHRSLLVPDLNEPLLSVAGLADDGLVSVFDDNVQGVILPKDFLS